ncbi:hypothetical protein [Bradyrhizobium iriomotense]|uniref:CBS domain-containing protein n=1 Tax=Bradyrhizobium iriomotense TaxID=441950 RepID=A0ABQ6BCP9_9BRAD|nr:hypothetical protein [Bradyrhizobium iriomotense]GLR91858.1 hypothetical protein GCM10007857_85760 [Bradyrhizobium iriomotense]
MTHERNPYEKEFEELMDELDPLVPVVLKGYLLIERILDNLISSICFHLDHIWNGRFTFAQKVNLARAFAFNRDNHPVWTLVLALNALRNEIAHNRLSERTQKKMDQVRRLWLAEVDEYVRMIDAEDTDPLMVIHAVADDIRCDLDKGTAR